MTVLCSACLLALLPLPRAALLVCQFLTWLLTWDLPGLVPSVAPGPLMQEEVLTQLHYLGVYLPVNEETVSFLGLPQQNLKLQKLTLSQPWKPAVRNLAGHDLSEALREDLFFGSSSFWWLFAYLDLWLHVCLYGPTVFSTSACQIALGLTLVRKLVIGFRTHLDNRG